MDLRLSRGEYWILNSMVEACYPLCWLGGSRPEVTFNRISSHGLSREGLVETLEKLFERRWIEAWRTHRNEDWTKSRDTPFDIDRASISTALSEPSLSRTVRSCVYCGLTPKGGTVWEQFASPRWERFLDYSLGEDEGTIVGPIRHRVMSYLACFREEGYDIDEASVTWKTLSPWEATYWKTLPVGLEASFRINASPVFGDQDVRRYNGIVARCQFGRWYDWK